MIFENVMDKRIIYLASSCVLFAAIIIGVWFSSGDGGETGKHRCDVLTAILSARENVVLRNAARATWFHDVTTVQWCKPVFVVGDTPCYVHPLDRADEFSCLPINLTKKCGQQSIALRVTPSQTIQPQVAITNFAFKVNVNIAVKGLGILSGILSRNSFPASVSLYDAITDNVVCSVAFTSVESGVEVDGYVYRMVQNCVLPEGFEGIMSAKTSDERMLRSPLRFQVTWDTGGNLISFSNMNVEHYYSNDAIRILDTKRPPTASMMFALQSDCNEYEKYVHLTEERARNWTMNVARQQAELEREAREHRDIVFVPITDVYRNLPAKLLSFYQKALELYNFDFLVKMDDDTILDVAAISKGLLGILEERKDRVWWGNFRVNWKVYRFGKWGEKRYNAVSYPPFACGAANAMSSDLVTWLSRNKDDLHAFQGEDTSVGIWLAAVQPHYEDDIRWNCGDDSDECCNPETFSFGQLNADEIRRKYQLIQQNKSLCESPCTSK